MFNNVLFGFLFLSFLVIPTSLQAAQSIKVQDFKYKNQLPSNLSSTWQSEVLTQINKKKNMQTQGFMSGSMTPTGALEIPMSPDCQPSFIKQALMNSTSTNEQSEAIDSYFTRCGERLKGSNKVGLNATLALDGITYKIFENKKVKSYQMTLSNGNHIQGFMALHTDMVPRPMVIVRCGLFCNGSPSGTTKMMLMHLFEESPFHVMVVQSHSSNQNLIANNRISIGGIYEAQETMAIGEWVKQTASFRHQISSLHMLGISLGGSDAFYTSLYNSQNSTGDGSSVYNSVMAFCPVTDLNTSMVDLYNNAGLVSSVITNKTHSNLEAAHPYVDDLLSQIDIDDLPRARILPEVLAELTRTFLNRQNPDSFLSPFTGSTFSTLEEFWEKSNFLNQFNQVTTPTLAWGSSDDPVVFFKNNSLKLKTQVTKQQPLQVASAKYGGHCAFSVSYGWAATSAILQGYFLSHSPNFKSSQTTQTQDLDFSSLNFSNDEVHVDQSWKARSGSSQLTLTFKVFSKGEFSCSNDDPFDNDKHCFDNRKLTIDISNLNIQKSAPNTKYDADRLTRWLNTNVTIYGSNGALLGTKDSPKSIAWR